MELVCSVQNYHWGKRGSQSLVAKLACSNKNIKIDGDTYFAEFWMGTHPNGPSILSSSNIPLSDHIKKNQCELGDKVIKMFGVQLPFLFKVLSVEKSLSIQTHPSKSEAEFLNKSMPHLYKDQNHKPEMAIALTEFKALCSFRPQKEIKFFLKNISEFHLIITQEKIDIFLECDEHNFEDSAAAMKNCFTSLMMCPASVVEPAVDNLINRLGKLDENLKKKYYYDLVLKLNKEFPGDVGIFCIYWLNYLELNCGEAIFLSPNEPHAYLSGDCIECMANSDNVIRAGLTTKFRDVKTLCQMLSYKCYQPMNVIFLPVTENEFSQLFSPPIEDFSVAKIIVPVGKEYSLLKRESASLLLVIEGKGITGSGIHLKSGSVFYLPTETEFSVKSYETTIIFQAFCNVNK